METHTFMTSICDECSVKWPLLFTHVFFSSAPPKKQRLISLLHLYFCSVSLFFGRDDRIGALWRSVSLIPAGTRKHIDLAPLPLFAALSKKTQPQMITETKKNSVGLHQQQKDRNGQFVSWAEVQDMSNGGNEWELWWGCEELWDEPNHRVTRIFLVLVGLFFPS